MSRLHSRLSFANVTALIALFVALGGTAYAVEELGKNTVGTKQLKKDAVTSAKVKDGSLLVQDFKKGSLPSGANGATGPGGPAGSQGSAGPQGPAGAGGTGGGGAGETVPVAAVTNTISHTTVNNASSAVLFEEELFDTANMHPSGAEGRKLIAPKDGIYELGATISFAPSAVGLRRIAFAVNEQVNPPVAESSAAGSAEGNTLSMSGLAKLKAGDYVVLNEFQNSGTTLSVLGTGNFRGPQFSMHWVGPAS